MDVVIQRVRPPSFSLTLVLDPGSGSLWRILLFLLFFRLVAFWWFTEETLATDDAGTIAPGVGEISNWKTSVHMPELNIGPASSRKTFSKLSNIIQALKWGRQIYGLA